MTRRHPDDAVVTNPNPRRPPSTHDPRSLPRETHVGHAAMRLQNTPRTQSPRHSAATHPRHARDTPPSTHDPRSLPRETHVGHACTKHTPNPIPTAQRRDTPAACPRHTSNTPDPRSLLRKTRPGRTIPHACHATCTQCARRHSEGVAPSRIPAQGHGFENLLVATPPP